MLLKSAVPVHAEAARAGHARASTTLDSYSHLLGREDGMSRVWPMKSYGVH